MKILNSPILALIVLIAFVALSYHCYKFSPVVIYLPEQNTSQQQGYDVKQVRKMDRLVALKVKQADAFNRVAPELLKMFNN